MAWIAAAPALAGAAVSLFGGMKARQGQQDTNVANAALAQKQMDFQERMSGTAHQREVADLRAAGLNPILSGTGGAGASTPGGAMATMENPQASMGAGMSSAGEAVSSIKVGPQMAAAKANAQAANSAATSAAAQAAIDSAKRDILLGSPVEVQVGDRKRIPSLLRRQLEAETSSAQSGAKRASGEAARVDAFTELIKEHPDLAKWIPLLQGIFGVAKGLIP